MQSVALHRIVIQEAAKKLIESKSYEEDGSILIRACDLAKELQRPLPRE
jgi:flagellin-specific chaperone FliS